MFVLKRDVKLQLTHSHGMWVTCGGDGGAISWLLCCQFVTEDRRDVQAVFGAAVVAASLRLRHASRQVRPDRRRKPQAPVSTSERSHPPSQGHHGRQPSQVPLSGSLSCLWCCSISTAVFQVDRFSRSIGFPGRPVFQVDWFSRSIGSSLVSSCSCSRRDLLWTSGTFLRARCP